MRYVISLGGSIIVPYEIDAGFVKKFTKLILEEAREGNQFFIVTGGGDTARKYIRALRKMGKHITSEDLDWIGIDATKINAQLLISAFGKAARKKLITDPSEHKKGLKKINLISGWRPGWSTDYVAVRIAQTYGIKAVVNLSNIDYVYNRNPNGSKKGLKQYEKMTWNEYIKKFGAKWDPGANFPFDPVGAGLARKKGIKVVVMNGKKLGNFKNFLENEPFKGTVISA